MAVSLYFGLPGAGKTTIMCKLMIKALRSGRYKHVYCNVYNSIPGVTYIDNFCIGLYDIRDALLCIDEATLFADNRDYKAFSKERVQYFLYHRHYNVDILLFTQQWDGVDRKIRVITDRVYYIYKGLFLGRWFTRGYRVPYGIIIPDKRNDSEKLGEIVQGYCKPGWLSRLFGLWVYRPRYYKYFDSWDRPPLPELPERYVAYEDKSSSSPVESSLSYSFDPAYLGSRLPPTLADWYADRVLPLSCPCYLDSSC